MTITKLWKVVTENLTNGFVKRFELCVCVCVHSHARVCVCVSVQGEEEGEKPVGLE